jgi:hypothetical protein
MQKQPPFWRFQHSQLCWPILSLAVKVTELEQGQIALSLKVLEAILNKILHIAAQLGLEGVGLPLFSLENFQQIARCLQQFHDAAELAKVAMAAEKPEDIMAFLKEH